MLSQPRYTTFQERKLQLAVYSSHRRCRRVLLFLSMDSRHAVAAAATKRSRGYHSSSIRSKGLDAWVVWETKAPDVLRPSGTIPKRRSQNWPTASPNLTLRALNTQRIKAASAVSCGMSINAAAPLWLRAALLKHRAHLNGDVVGRIVRAQGDSLRTRRVRSSSESATASP